MTVEKYKENLEYVLKNCTFRDCDSVEYRHSILRKIECGELPIRLYQYRKVDKIVVEGLKSGTICFKSPIRFNDPYDSLLCWDKHQIEEYFRNPKYANVLARHCVFDSDTLAVSIRNRFRISCFSELPDSLPMWAHYANSGTGFCVEYEFPICIGSPLCLKSGDVCKGGNSCNPKECGLFSNCSLAPIFYSAQRPDATSAMKQEIEYAVASELGVNCDLKDYDWLEPYRTALFKSTDWSYEKEWRLILSDHSLRGDTDYVLPCDMLKRVILGSNMDPLEEYQVSMAVEAYAKNQQRKIDLDKAYVEVQSENYKLDIRHERTIRAR